jgi:hypothetical protein
MRVAAWAAILTGLITVMPAAAEPGDTTTSKVFLAQLQILRERHGLNQLWLREDSSGQPPPDIAVGGKADAVLPVASLSKSITAIAIALLIQRDELHLDSRLGDLLPGYFAIHGARLRYTPECAPASGLYHRERAMLRLERYRMQPFPNELDDMPDRAS